jgi:hypothetical protein
MSLAKQLPFNTIVNRVIPKNAFDSYTNVRQKKQMIELIERIRWTNKLSLETINLSGREISEIQIFEIELRKKEYIVDLLQVIDKAIPYHVIFQISYGDMTYISTSKKHPHPGDENTSVIDWTFSTEWFDIKNQTYFLKLERSLDHIFLAFCKRLSGQDTGAKTMEEQIAFSAKTNELIKSIGKIKSRLLSCKQFNKRVELNIELQSKELELQRHQNS